MNVHVLQRRQRLPGSPDEVFAFFADARNLEAITPPLLRFEIRTPAPIAMQAGTRIDYRLRVRGVPVRWTTVVREWAPPGRFVDEQVRGPYELWRHTHTFDADGGGATVMGDRVEYAVGLGPLGELAARAFVHRDVAAIFDFRARRIVELL